MRKFIVTTTINEPTEALLRFNQMKEWNLIIVGDLKTPHSSYVDFDYIHPSSQEKEFPKLSELIGWNCIQRRNFGFIEALKRGAEIIATVDDDNIPLENWGKNLKVNTLADGDFYSTELDVFDPLSATNHPELWHRGFPIQLVKEKNKIKKEETKEFTRPLVQADLWNGEADVDAIERINLETNVEFKIPDFFYANKISPFNSQNTFLSSEIFPDYFLFPHIGRMDDIWAAYYIQDKFQNSVIYGPASVYQKRNIHNLAKDIENEVIGYHYSLEVAKNPKSLLEIIPERSKFAFEEYKKIIMEFECGRS